MNAIDAIIETKAWEAAIADPQALASRCYAAVKKSAPALTGSAALLFADDQTLREMNRRFRHIDKPTNVLSFPAGDGAPGFSGDIAIAFETCAREAEEKSISLADHAAHLIVHGLLHLAGFDHEEHRQAEVMEAKETAILEMLGVADPYAIEETTKLMDGAT